MTTFEKLTCESKFIVWCSISGVEPNPHFLDLDVERVIEIIQKDLLNPKTKPGKSSPEDREVLIGALIYLLKRMNKDIIDLI